MSDVKTPDSDTWFEVLVLRYLSDELEQSECDKLDALLQTNSQYRKLFVEICYQSTLFKESLDNRVNELCSTQPDTGNWNILSDVIELEEEVTKLKIEKEQLSLSSVEDSTVSEDSNQKTKLRDRQIVIPTGFFYAALLTITCILGLSTYFNNQSVIPPEAKKSLITDTPYVATIESTKDCVWKNEYIHGQNLKPGKLTLIKGKAKLKFYDNTEVELVGPAEIELLDIDRCNLLKGSLAAYCPPGSEGFTVDIPGGVIVDRGTLFNVNVKNIGEKSLTDIIVEAGKIDLSSKNSDGKVLQTVKLNVDQQVKLDSDDPVINVYRKQPVEIFGTGYGITFKERDPYWNIKSSTEANVKPGPAYIKRVDVNGMRTSVKQAAKAHSVQWITVDPKDGDREDNTTTTYRTEFYLGDFDLDTVRITAKFIADDYVTGIRINGTTVNVIPEQQPDIALKNLKTVEFKSNFKQAKNVIEFDVLNKGGGVKDGAKGAPNKTGLLVILEGHGAKLEPAQ